MTTRAAGSALLVLALCASAAPAAVKEVMVKIPSNCAAGTGTVSATVHERTGDILLWHFVNECKNAHTVYLCPASDDPFLWCRGTGVVEFKTPFMFASGTATPGTTTEAAVCTVKYKGNTGKKFTYYIVDGPDAGSVTCPPKSAKIPRSELALEVQP